MMSFRTFFRLQGKNKLHTLIFHRVHFEPDPLFPNELYAERFDLILTWLKSWFTILPLETAVNLLKNKNLPPAALAITFDDGYADNIKIALPILKKHGLSATFFISTSFLDGGRMWNDTIIESIRATKTETIDLRTLNLGIYPNHNNIEKQDAIQNLINQIKYLPSYERDKITNNISEILGNPLPDNLMMTSKDIQELHQAGMTIASHTCTHPILTNLDLPQAREEILNSKLQLEALTGNPINLFAYPNGKPNIDYTREHVHLVENLGFSAAFSTSRGIANQYANFFELPRFTPWDRGKFRLGIRLFGNFFKSK